MTSNGLKGGGDKCKMDTKRCTLLARFTELYNCFALETYTQAGLEHNTNLNPRVMLDAVQSCTGIGNSKLCRWRLAGKELTKALGKRILEEKALQSHEFS